MVKKNFLSNSLNILKKNLKETKKDFSEMMKSEDDFFKMPVFPTEQFRMIFDGMKKKMEDFINETKAELDSLQVSNGIIETDDGVDFVFSNLKSTSNTIKVEQEENTISVTCTDSKNSEYFEKKSFSTSNQVSILNYSSEIMPDVIVVHVKLKTTSTEE